MAYLYADYIDPNICIGNTLSTFNDNFLSLDEEIQLRTNFGQERVAFAWGSFDTGLEEMVLGGYYNLSGIRDAAGQYTFTFLTPTNNNVYVVMVGASALGVTAALREQTGHVHTKTSGGFKVEWGTLAAAADPDFIDVVVYSI